MAAKRTTTAAAKTTSVGAHRPKVQHLSVLLMKNGISSKGDALKDPQFVTSHAIDTKLLPDSSFYTETQRPKIPKWVDFVEEGLKDNLSIHGTTVSAVLFVEADGRCFAFTFGFGRNLLKPESIERDFGLKVVLNRVDPENLRSIDLKNFEALTIHTRRQTSRGSTLDTFGINTAQDLLRSVTGNPEDQGFAKRVAGSDGLALAAALTLQDLPRKCVQLLSAYNDTRYKQRFEFVDQMKSVRDPSMIAKLDRALEQKLHTKDFTGIHLAPPEPQDWENIESFHYSPDRQQPFTDLDIDDYISVVGQPPTIDELKKHVIGVIYKGSSHSVKKWTVRDSLVCELTINGQIYVLSSGDWFEIAKSFADRILKRVKDLTSSFSLPKAKLGEREASYNERVAVQKKYAHMDCKLNNTYETPIEVCDLFTNSKKFIHVKRNRVSATLSHLFAQGVVSAEAFASDEHFRQELRRQLRPLGAAFLSSVPTADVRPVPSEYEVVYAIITKPDPKWPASLPFFSQLNLVNASDRISRMGFRVSLVKIDVT
ncbi:DUF6119 family protein [Sorangium sp. So ce1151]|uniref:DUF6119 family protein n=1 Tax=Sorangium sp. So ce1151 TaxID=3133332 RepID=UPI003F5F1CEA